MLRVNTGLRLWLMAAAMWLLPVDVKAEGEVLDLPSMTVLGSASDAELLVNLARHFSTQERISVSVIIGSSHEHLNMLKEGAPADLVVSNDPWLIQELKQRGLVDVYSYVAVFKDRLVLAVPQEPEPETEEVSQAEVVEPADAMSVWNLSVVTDAPMSVPPGGDWVSVPALLQFVQQAHRTQAVRSYADVREWLLKGPLYTVAEDDGAIGKIGDRIMETLYIPKSVRVRAEPVADSRQLLNTLAKEHGVGFVYQSDVTNLRSDGFESELRFIPLDAKLQPETTYYAMAVAGEQMDKARAFLKFMKSPQMQLVYPQFGVTPY